MFSSPATSLYLALSFLATICQSSPLPQDVRVVGPSTSNQICSLSAENAGDTWRNSGASNTLDSFIRNRSEGSLSWANAITQSQKTSDGRPVDSVVDCADLSGSCPPLEDCVNLEKPELFHIRSAMSTCHRLLVGVENHLQTGTIRQILQLSKLVEDFGEPEQPEDKTLDILSASFGIASGLAAPIAPVSGALTIISSAFALRKATMRDNPPVDVRPGIEQLLLEMFDALLESNRALTRKVFGGDTDTAVITEGLPVASNAEETDIGKFFANGRFLIPARVSLDRQIEEIVDMAMGRVKQALVIRALKERGFFIWIDEFLNEFGKCGSVGSRFINGLCFQIAKETNFGNGFEVIDAETVLKFDNPSEGYNIDLEEFYKNAESCTFSNPDLNGELRKENIRLDSAYPPCFFNMRVFRGKQSPKLCGTRPSFQTGCFNQPPVEGV